MLKKVDQLGGENIVVEVDESAFSHRKNNKGRKKKTVWGPSGMERSATKRVFLTIVRWRDFKTLTKQLLKNVKLNTEIYSDCWKGYNKIHEYIIGHKKLNHLKNFVNPKTGCHT